jgi:hypothetical protein
VASEEKDFAPKRELADPKCTTGKRPLATARSWPTPGIHQGQLTGSLIAALMPTSPATRD